MGNYCNHKSPPTWNVTTGFIVFLHYCRAILLGVGSASIRRNHP